jgi:hypothetical protein
MRERHCSGEREADGRRYGWWWPMEVVAGETDLLLASRGRITKWKRWSNDVLRVCGEGDNENN